MIVTPDEEVAGFVPKVPVMPAGQFEATNVTAELKPLAGAIVMVDVPVNPTFAATAVALIVKLGAALTVNEIEALADKVPLVPFTVSV